MTETDQILDLQLLLSDVLACWQSRPLMDGTDQGHFNQTRLRELYPRLRAAVPYDLSPTDPQHGGKIWEKEVSAEAADPLKGFSEF